MNDKLEETILDFKTPRLNNPESYVLTQNRFNAFMVLIFSDFNKTQIYKMPHRDGSHHKLEIVKSFNSLNVFKPIDYTEDYHNG